ncbi:MAG: dUTP diphosphatase [Chlamydiae bacterium]|nr:dUTP diphosphatase [Chlamydiota bacterium]
MTSEIIINVITEDDEFLPVYSSELAAGADVKAYINENVAIEPGSSALIPTGLKFEIPAGYEIQVRPRSGLALKNQITVLNTPGTVDADYRGEIGVILINHGKTPFIVSRGMRIAQIVLAAAPQAKFFLAKDLSLTSRGAGGFGHTGTH